MTDKSYIGKGIVYRDGKDIGNVSALSLAIEQDEITLGNYRTGGGGNYNSLPRISSVGVSMTLHDYNAANLAAALFGTASSVTSAVVTDESIAAPADLTEDTLVETTFVIDTSVAPVVTSDPAGTTYVEDTDYTVTTAGIIILASGSITASAPLLISYTKKAVDVVEGATTSAQEVELVFVGLNEAQSGTPMVVKIHRAKFNPTDELALIGDEFGAITLSGEALADATITGAGLSQFCKIQAA